MRFDNGEGFEAADVHTYILAKARGEKAPRPRQKAKSQSRMIRISLDRLLTLRRRLNRTKVGTHSRVNSIRSY